MAVEHLVWFRFRDDLDDEHIERTLDELRALKDKVPSIQRLAAGKNFTDRSNGYTHGLIVTLDSRDALQAYATDPAHVKVVELLKQDTTDIAALDFET